MRFATFAVRSDALLLFFIAVVSARSLNSISPIKQSDVPPACYTAYNTEFSSQCPAGPSNCSTECITWLSELARKVNAACGTSFVGMNGSLRRIHDGGIKDVVCGAAANSGKHPSPSDPSDKKLPPSIPATKAADYKALLNDTKSPSANDLVLDTRPQPTVGSATDQSSKLVIEGSQTSSLPAPSATSAQTHGEVKTYPANSTDSSGAVSPTNLPSGTGAPLSGAKPTDSPSPPDSAASGELRNPRLLVISWLIGLVAVAASF